MTGAILAGMILPALAEPLTVVEQGQSPYSIYRDLNAPGSVKRAAGELQRVIEKATGVKLPIKTAPDESPAIFLGNTAAAQAAGLDKDLPENGFRITTKGQNIFILGRDSADGQERWTGMPEQGTLFGTYEFLERVTNVRWLMPSDLGEDVPKADKLVVNDLDIRAKPPISLRYLLGVKDRRPDVGYWKTRSKLDINQGGVGPSWAHSFNSYPPDAVRKANPEFMPVKKDGTRAPVPPANHPHVQYCLSNPQLIEAFADAIMADFEKAPKRYSSSMAPDEGAEWCECPECSKLAMAIPEHWKNLGVNEPQRTPVVLNFYNEVAKRVRAKYPERVLGGMVYQDYLVPLEKPITMEPNMVIGIAINSAYGFKFYQPKRREIVQQLFDEWAKYGVPLGYYDYSTWMRNWFGLPLPPGRPLLKWLFPMIAKNHVTILKYFGMEPWGYGAVQNYMVAKLMWNPEADVDALYHEFLTRAYGPEAAPLIDRMYNLIEERLQAYIQSKTYPDHEIDYESAREIYAPIYPEIEKICQEALEKTQTDEQRKRLELLTDNLVLANFHMRHANLLSPAEAEKSPFYRSDEDIAKFIREKEGTLGIINVAEWVRNYGRSYKEMPVLKEGWRPK